MRVLKRTGSAFKITSGLTALLFFGLSVYPALATEGTGVFFEGGIAHPTMSMSQAASRVAPAIEGRPLSGVERGQIINLFVGLVNNTVYGPNHTSPIANDGNGFTGIFIPGGPPPNHEIAPPDLGPGSHGTTPGRNETVITDLPQAQPSAQPVETRAGRSLFDSLGPLDRDRPVREKKKKKKKEEPLELPSIADILARHRENDGQTVIVTEAMRMQQIADLLKQLEAFEIEDQDAGQIGFDEATQTWFRVLDSVILSPRLAAVHTLVNPPKSLHPFLRVMLYRRLLNSDILSWYWKTRQKIDEINQTAKEGETKIRYKGKIRDYYLPLPDDLGGKYELIAILDPSQTAPGSHRASPSKGTTGATSVPQVSARQ